MASTNSSWIPVAGLALLVGLAGGFSGALLFADRGASPTTAAPSPSNDESVAVLRELTGEVRQLREAIEMGASSRPQGASSERAPMEAPATDRLERAIERLAEVLATPGSAVQARRGNVSKPPSALKPKATDRLLALCAMSEEDRGRAYYFWSRDEFMDQFGAPDEVSAQGEGSLLRLEYKIGEERVIKFSFTNDMLFYIDCND